MTPPPPITRLGAQRAARRELSKSIYHRHSESIPARIISWLGKQFDKLLGRAFSHAPGGSLGALALVVVIAIVIALAVWRIGPPRRAGATGSVLDTTARIESASDHRSRAEQAAGSGNYSMAVIESMRAVARELEERHILQARAGRTASELSREAGLVVPGAADALRRAADTFNSVAYGGGNADRAMYEVMVAADDAARQSSRTAAAAR